jgi:hypothetical protein
MKQPRILPIHLKIVSSHQLKLLKEESRMTTLNVLKTVNSLRYLIRVYFQILEVRIKVQSFKRIQTVAILSLYHQPFLIYQ